MRTIRIARPSDNRLRNSELPLGWDPEWSLPNVQQWRAGSASCLARREEFVETLFSAVPIVDITLPVMRIFGEIDAKLRARGARLPTSDLLIGFTALSREDGIVTGNPRHFPQIPRLTVHEWA